MNLSISQRLAAMFAITSLVLLSMAAVAMHCLLERELTRHQMNELESRWHLHEPFIHRNNDAAYWDYVASKLDSILTDSQRVRMWVVGEDDRFRYGADLDEAQRATAYTDGFGELMVEGRHMKSFSGEVAAHGERPAVRMMIALDSTPFAETLQTFTMGLVALMVLGAVAAAALGSYIAGIGLRPLGRLSREAQALTPNALSRRLQTDTLPPELSQLAQAFNGALGRLESAYQHLEAFNADVAHELRTPLGNLIGQTQVTLSRERDAQELKELLHSNLEDLERLRGIVNDMLFLARADRGESAPNRVEVSVAQEVQRAVEFLEFVLEEAEVKVRIEGDARASIETSLFGRAITNLLQNAVQHAPRGAEVVVDVRQQSSDVRVSVRNPGPSIGREHLARMFDRFYRVDSARSGSHENHGLGLAIVRAIATMHGGNVFADSGEQGTIIGFTVAAG